MGRRAAVNCEIGVSDFTWFDVMFPALQFVGCGLLWSLKTALGEFRAGEGLCPSLSSFINIPLFGRFQQRMQFVRKAMQLVQIERDVLFLSSGQG